VGDKETIFSALKVSRQCPLVLLVGMKPLFMISLHFNCNGVGGTTLKRHLI
jgi:hypothetical protein